MNPRDNNENNVTSNNSEMKLLPRMSFRLEVGNAETTLTFERINSQYNLFNSRYSFTAANQNGTASCYMSIEVGNHLMNKLRMNDGSDLLKLLDSLGPQAAQCATIIRNNDENHEKKIIIRSFQL